ncbi:hypothetical protein NVS89_02160 [Ancylobacter sp. MQZ15Z-1]|uniref:Uncharacterized protein n=1 Tax=Ancylobacter mangrovi TaxID=2972472 RepID=A0A9X2P9K9_9HYPH|nr:hypothetical protein [Ancylobacter mangrovi]MCS0493885.1 hypothetical protein [Ancylobacter mangrovi]
MPTTVLAGSGWLRTAFASSTADYEITLRRPDTAGAPSFAEGVLRAEVTIMIEARAARRATLVLASERSAPIEIRDLTPAGLTFRLLHPERLSREKDGR